MRQGSKDKFVFYLYFFVIVSASLVVFFPSFQHTFRSDQVVYFANTREHHDMISLVKDYCAYSQVRQYNPGDIILFRPLVFVVLGFEKALFNMHYSYWHIFGFALHMLTVFFLFKILYDLKPGLFAFLCSLLYACWYGNIEIVIWEHINSYVLFNALILCSFYYFKRGFDSTQQRNDPYFVPFLLTVCAFLHEWGSVFAMIFAVCFYFKNIETGRIQDNKKIWLFFLPGCLYMLFYIWVNLFYQFKSPGNIPAEIFSKTFQISNLIHVIKFVPKYFYQLISNGLFPSLISGKLYFMDRLTFVHRTVFSGEFLFNLIAICGLAWLIFKSLSVSVMKQNKIFICLLGGLVFCQLITLPLFRLPTHGERYILQTSSYYGYFFWSYLLVIIFMLVDWHKIDINQKGPFRSLAIASLIVLIFINGFEVRELNRDIRSGRWAWQQYIDKINGFIAIHGKEPNFSFYVLKDVPIQFQYKIKGSAKPGVEQLDLASIFYYPYNDPHDPKYTLVLGQDGPILQHK